MPQFEMQKITANKCHETNHMGKPNLDLCAVHLLLRFTKAQTQEIDVYVSKSNRFVPIKLRRILR